jgi:hypothetical protein
MQTNREQTLVLSELAIQFHSIASFFPHSLLGHFATFDNVLTGLTKVAAKITYWGTISCAK